MDLSKMSSKLRDENKQPLRENRHVKSFQTSPGTPVTQMGQKGVAGSSPAMGKKELDFRTEEIAKNKLLKHQQALYLEVINNLKECLQELLRRLEEKTKASIKDKRNILEVRELVMSQDKVLEGMQIEINHLYKQLNHLQQIGSRNSKELQIQREALGTESSQEKEEAADCPRSLSQKIAMVKLTQKSVTRYLKEFHFCLRNCVWLLVRHFLRCGCTCLTLLLVYKHLPDAIWTYQLLDSICHQPWPH